MNALWTVLALLASILWGAAFRQVGRARGGDPRLYALCGMFLGPLALPLLWLKRPLDR